ncbi:hypothetical protein [Nocardia sp. XZ_19_385]|uniref:hypothetical protein n=1 Tax=Nocardia sp. XZ_19_385 TaxID=2769488 RepID=UPI00188EECD5|nr:hypothetical protein [Nocardia sp. XZ_19_385]
MGMRRAFALVGLTVLGATLTGTIQAGSATAAVPFADPKYGLFFGLILNHDETVALSNSQLPNQLDGMYMSGARVALLDVDAAETDEHTPTLALPEDSLPEVVRAAAATPAGMFGFTIVNPMLNEGRLVRVIAIVE